MKKNCWLFFIGITLFSLSSCTWVNNSQFSMFRPSDQAITTSINTELMNNKLIAGVPIQVETHGGIVTLSGYVKTIRQNDIANEIASNSIGVKSVENNLVVRK